MVEAIKFRIYWHSTATPLFPPSQGGDGGVVKTYTKKKFLLGIR